MALVVAPQLVVISQEKVVKVVQALRAVAGPLVVVATAAAAVVDLAVPLVVVALVVKVVPQGPS